VLPFSRVAGPLIGRGQRQISELSLSEIEKQRKNNIQLTPNEDFFGEHTYLCKRTDPILNQ